MFFKCWIIFIDSNWLFLKYFFLIIVSLGTLWSCLTYILRFFIFIFSFLRNYSHCLRIKKLSLMIGRSMLYISFAWPSSILKSSGLESWSKFTVIVRRVILILDKNILVYERRWDSCFDILSWNTTFAVSRRTLEVFLWRHEFEIIILNSYLYKNYYSLIKYIKQNF